MNLYDECQQSFANSTAQGAEAFFEKLNFDLRPPQEGVWRPMNGADDDPDIFAPEIRGERYWISTNGKQCLYGHKEGDGGSNLPGLLFD